MRVLLTADTVGGVWTYAMELVRGLIGLGMEIALATMGAPLNAQQRSEVSQLRRLHLFESDFKLEWMDDPWADVEHAGAWLLDIERQMRPDVIHLNSYVHAAMPWRAPRLVTGHSCVLSWWQAVKGESAPAGWNRYKHEVRQGIQAADLVVAPTIAMLAALDHHYGPLSNAQVISNGRDAGLFVSPKGAAKQPVILAAGRLWDEAKNISLLGEIAPRISWPVYVAGETHHPSGGSLAMTNVRALGRLPAGLLAHWLARASIYALPAKYEPFGLSILEAALSRCALVLGDIPSLRENWEGAAVFVSPGDAQALRIAIEALIADPQQREALGAQAQARALKFTPQRMAAEYLGAYESLTAGRAAPSGREMAHEMAHDRVPQ